MKKSKFVTGIIILTTLILAGVAIFTAVRLYQLRSQPVAPNVPSSKPKAQEASSCSLSFTIGTTVTATPTVTSTATPTSTSTSVPTPTDNATQTPTATPTTPAGTPNSCGGTCGSNSNCGSDLICYQGFCRNSSCVFETDCSCAGAPTPTQASLPNSGTEWPTILSIGVGVFVIVGSMLLAL